MWKRPWTCRKGDHGVKMNRLVQMFRRTVPAPPSWCMNSIQANKSGTCHPTRYKDPEGYNRTNNIKESTATFIRSNILASVEREIYYSEG
jgi:hypothetical protein